MTNLTILLATYNGEKYLNEQLDSIFSQTYSNYVLVARDDGSADNTRDILFGYQRRYTQKLIIVPSHTHTGAPKRNFGELIHYLLRVQADLFKGIAYIAFSDQDDIWQPNKLEVMLENLQQAEQMYPMAPLIVHSDLELIDASGQLIHKSLSEYQGFNPKRNFFAQIAIRNVVTGCAMMLNRRALEIGYPIPEEAIEFDWWLSLSTAAFGKIIFLKERTTQYRQHIHNFIGARRSHGFCLSIFKIGLTLLSRITTALHRVMSRFFWTNGQSHKRDRTELEIIMSLVTRQNQYFLSRYKENLKLWQRKVLKKASGMESRGSAVRRFRIYWLMNIQPMFRK